MISLNATTLPHDAADCGRMQDVLELVGRRWTGAVLLAGTRGARRFGEYRRLINGISDRLLSQHLKELGIARTPGTQGDPDDPGPDPLPARAWR